MLNLAACTAPRARERRRFALARAGQLVRQNSLGQAFFTLFLLCIVGQVGAGWRVHNEQAVEHGQAAIGLLAYLGSGHFLEAMFENWESEFLQMALFVVLTAVLFQKGSAESKELDEQGATDSSQFWFESFQNWQSEFLAVFAMVLLSIVLRQRGSTQSKPVAAPHRQTGSD
jgi:hypothetical protein